MQKHLDALYSYAQVLTLDTTQALNLVEKTVEAVLEQQKSRHNPFSRIELFQLMSRIYRELPPPLPSRMRDGSLSRTATDVEGRFIAQFLDKAMPAAFSGLAISERTVLTLCIAEHMSCADAAQILDQDSDRVCQALDRARESLKSRLMASATPVEKVFFKRPMDPKILAGAIQRFHRDSFGPLPPTAEPLIKAKLEPENLDEKGQAEKSIVSTSGSQKSVRFGSRQLVIGVILIVLSGLFGYLGTSFLSENTNTDVLSLSGQMADDITVTLSTNNTSEAEEFITTHLSRQLEAPVILNSELQGVSLYEVVENVQVPVLLYADQSDEANDYIVLFVYNYALLDQHEDRLMLSNEVWEQINTEATIKDYVVNRKLQGVIWRKRDDIYIAYTEGNAEALKERIALDPSPSS